MGGLQHGQLGVAQEPAGADLQEGACGHVVAVEHGDEFARSDLERLVDVAGLGIAVVIARQVADADLGAEVAELLAAPVVQHVHLEFFARPVQAHGSEGRLLHHLQRFVVGGNEDVDRRPAGHVGGHGQRLALQRPGRLEVAEQQHHHGVQLGDDQAGAEEGVDKTLETGGFGHTPVDVAHGGGDREGDHGQRGQPAGHLAQHQGRTEADAGENHLADEVERHGEDQHEQADAEQRGDPARQLALPEGLVHRMQRPGAQPRRRAGLGNGEIVLAGHRAARAWPASTFDTACDTARKSSVAWLSRA